MTTGTGHIFMFSVKREAGVVVVKFAGFPVVEIMTFHAIGFAVDVKLFEMFIGVAFRAIAC